MKQLLTLGLVCLMTLFYGCGGASSRMTKQDWWTKLETSGLKSKDAKRVSLGVAQDKFLSIMGKPSKTQAIGNRVYWYYECADGSLQLEIDKDLLDSSSMIYSETVNEF